MQNKLIKLEALRGFAALYVVLHHSIHNFQIAGLNLSFLFRFGQEAVILFFVLSGFVIEYSYSKSKDKSFKTYFLKRFLRIYIPLLCVFITHYAILSFENKLNMNWQDLFCNLLMLQDVDTLKPNVISPTFLGNNPLWSLSYEWWFYMLFFPLSYYFKSKSSYIVYALGIFSALNRELMYFTIWWSGVEIARLYANSESINFKNLKLNLMSISAIVLILGFNAIWHYRGESIGIHPILELRHFGFAIIALSISLFWNAKHWKGFSSVFQVFAWFAPISYGVYISHYFLISTASYLDPFIESPAFKSGIYIIICILFSYLIEIILYKKLSRYSYKTKLS